MPNKLDYLALLRATIKQLHKCDAIHRQTVPVHETVDGRTMWKGEVEIFELENHTSAKKCFAWTHHEEGQPVRCVTVLEKLPVNSPEMAVKSAIFFNAQPVPYPRSHPA